MAKTKIYGSHPGFSHYYVVRKPYGFWNFCLDLFMIGVTGGLWLIWIFFREVRGR